MYLAICDDDILLCANLRRKLAAFDTGGNKLIVDEYHSGEELLKDACRCNYDAVFLDLYMEGMSGFDTAKALAERKSEARIIFLTSNESLVFDSFEYQPFYFLRKENYTEVLPKVMARLKTVLNQNGTFLLDGKNEKESIAVSSICYVASDKHNVVIYTTKYSYEVRKTMTETLKQLEPYDFVRIHKQYLVNLKYVKKVNMRDETVLLMNDTVLDMSRRCKDTVLERFTQYQRNMNGAV